MGVLPARSAASFASSTSTQVTACPVSAKQVPATSPTYPVPTTAMCIRRSPVAAGLLYFTSYSTVTLFARLRGWSVLHFARRVALGVDVRDLLQLEGAFEGDRVLRAAAEEQQISRRRELVGGLLDLLFVLQRLLDERGKLAQVLEVLARRRDVERPAQAAEANGEEEERRQLGGEGLGGSDADLRTGMRVEDVVRLAGNGGADHVADGESAGSPRLGFAEAAQGVGGLAALRDGDAEGPRV